MTQRALSTSAHRRSWQKAFRNWQLHAMLIPALVLVFVFSYIPMYGVVIAFQRFQPAKGIFGNQQWVGLKNFEFVFKLPGFTQALQNTIIIAFFKILSGLVVPVIFALMLNEMQRSWARRTIQTMIYLPFFLSWIILSGALIDILSPETGIVNKVIRTLGGEPIFFLGDNRYFRGTLIVTHIWKEFGYGTIVYLAAITSIDPTLYEAAVIDGAGKGRQTWHVTLPGMRMIIVLLTVLSLGNVLNAGFDQVFNLYSAVVYSTGDIIDTMVYRMGLIDAKYGPATAVGLGKSVISLVFITVSYYLAYRLADYRIF